MRVLAPFIMVSVAALAGACSGSGGVLDALNPDDSACERLDNMMDNCGFDDGLEGWQITHAERYGIVGNDGASKAGCLELVGMDSDTDESQNVGVQQCVSVPVESFIYAFGVAIEVVAGWGQFSECFAMTTHFTLPDCAGDSLQFHYTLILRGDWGTARNGGATWGPNMERDVIRSVLVDVGCISWEAEDLIVRFDDFWFVETEPPDPPDM